MEDTPTQSQEKWQQAYTRFFVNAKRVYRLLSACLSHKTESPGGHQELEQVGSDIALSAMVFLYAAFETFIRDIAGEPTKLYSCVGKVERELKKQNADYSGQFEYLSSIGEMMERRHEIVHQADLSPGSSEPKRITYVESVSFTRWFHDVDFFVSELVHDHVTPECAAFVDRELQGRKKAREQFEAQQRQRESGT